MFNQIWSACTKEKGAMPQIVTLSKAQVHQNLSNERKATGVRSEIVSAVGSPDMDYIGLSQSFD